MVPQLQHESVKGQGAPAAAGRHSRQMALVRPLGPHQQHANPVDELLEEARSFVGPQLPNKRRRLAEGKENAEPSGACLARRWRRKAESNCSSQRASFVSRSSDKRPICCVQAKAARKARMARISC